MPEELQLPTLPDLKIVRDGKDVDTSAIDDYDSFMNFLMMASVAANTAKIRRYYDDRRPKGEVLNYDLNVTDQSQEIICSYPCQTLYLENKGANLIYVALNNRGKVPTLVEATRASYFEFDTHVIERFYVWALLGATSTAVALLKY